MTEPRPGVDPATSTAGPPCAECGYWHPCMVDALEDALAERDEALAEVGRLRADLAEARRRIKTIYDLVEARINLAALSAGDTTGGNDE